MTSKIQYTYLDYAYSQGVYVIIDIHYEDAWLYLGDVEAKNRAMLRRNLRSNLYSYLRRIMLQNIKDFNKNYSF